jgi:hypothetical protein
VTVLALIALLAPVAALPVATPAPAPHVAPARRAKGPVAKGKAGKNGKGKPVVWERAAEPLPFLPRVARVRLEVGHDSVLQILDIELDHDAYVKGDRKFWVSFGAPGVPKAVDAHLLSGQESGQEADANWGSNGDEIPFEAKPTRPRSANALLGPDRTSGLVFTVKEAPLQAAFAKGPTATLRLRALLPTPDLDSAGQQGVVVRLGTEDASYTLGRIEVVGRGGMKVPRADARICSFPQPVRDVDLRKAEIDREKAAKEAAKKPAEAPVPEVPLSPPPPLTVATVAPRNEYEARNRILPSLATRRPFDVLCIRYAAEAPPAKAP